MDIRNNKILNRQNFQIKFKVKDIQNHMQYYDMNKGKWRYFWDQEDIAKLRALDKKLQGENANDYLSAEDAYELVSILVYSQAQQNSLSSEIMLGLESKNKDLIAFSRFLNKHHFFSKTLFLIICNRLSYIDFMKNHISNLITNNVELTPAYVEVICKYAEKYDTFLENAIAKCIYLNANEDFIRAALKLMLQNKIQSFSLYSTIRALETPEQLKKSISDNKELAVLQAVECESRQKVITYC